jgi:hypothetical protein
VGYEPVDPDGSIIAMVELAWPQRKAAAVISEQKRFVSVLVRDGWTVMDLPATEAEVRKLLR